MSQDFKFKFDKMRENNPANSESDDEDKNISGEKYETSGNTRNLGFVWLDGKRMFLSYSYLISCEYQPVESLLVLTFTTHIFSLKGTLLENLYDELLLQIPKTIYCVDPRYNSVLEKDQFAVNAIAIEKNG